MLYGHLIAYKEFVYSGDLFYENYSLLQFSISCTLQRKDFFDRLCCLRDTAGSFFLLYGLTNML